VSARNRVVITGIGVICSLGVGREDVWRNALAGTPGGAHITGIDIGSSPVTIACQARAFVVEDFVDRRLARRADRVTHFALAAAQMAVSDARLTISADGRDTGCILGTGTGGNRVRDENHVIMLERGVDRISPFAIPYSMCNHPPAEVAMQMGLRGPTMAMVTACAAGTDAIGTSTAIIRRGDADVMLAGGTDAMITPLWLAGFDAMRVLSRHEDNPGGAGRPFDASRDGFLVGEGAAVLVLESLEHARARRAQIICEIAGYGASADAHHITDPDPTGISQSRAMRAAIADARIDADLIGYVNAHGGASRPGDPAEISAIRRALGDDVAARTAVSATKSMHGHCMGATGAIEAVLTALAVTEGRIPPTINLTDLDPDCIGVDHVIDTVRVKHLDAALSSNNGLGGHNAAIVLVPWQDA
jgi:3-oxoacyl-[acyl-carrier-protein] synthase II